MRTLSAPGITALDSGRFAVRCLLKVTIPSAPAFCIWDDFGTLAFGGDNFVGAVGRFSVDAGISSQDMSVRNLDVRLSGIDTGVAAIIDAQPWHQAPILIQRAVIAVDDPAVLYVTPEFSGWLDQMIWSEQAGGTSNMVFRCESASRELQRSGSRTRSDSDQRQRDASDGFFKFTVSAISSTVNWGRAPAKPQKLHGFAKLMDKIF